MYFSRAAASSLSGSTSEVTSTASMDAVAPAWHLIRVQFISDEIRCVIRVDHDSRPGQLINSQIMVELKIMVGVIL